MPPLIDLLGFRTDTRPLQLLGEAGFVWSYLGRWKEAEDVFNALIALVPNDPCAYLGLAELHLMQNHYPDAQRWGERSAKVAITRPTPNAGDRHTASRAYVVAGKALLHQGKARQALEAFAKAMDLDPKGPSGQHAREMIEAGRGAVS